MLRLDTLSVGYGAPRGTALLDDEDIAAMRPQTRAQRVAMVLTERPASRSPAGRGDLPPTTGNVSSRRWHGAARPRSPRGCSTTCPMANGSA